jgi:hypothetical protein
MAPLAAISEKNSGSMIDKREILEAASSFSLLPNVVEKDYVLGWILAGIYAHEELAETWVSKGGTCPPPPPPYATDNEQVINC